MGPLSGVKVVELAGLGPAPFGCMLLAELGADVLRVERPGGGLAMGPPELELVNRGRRSVALDLKKPEAVAAVLQLVAKADVLVEGFRPGVAERLGLGPEHCHAVNRRLVYGRMTGWGQDGPLAQAAGHDIDYLAVSGALHAIGRAGGPPQVPANLLGDFAGGSLYLVVGVLAALVEARSSGEGQVVDAAIVDGAAHLTTMLLGALAGGAWTQDRGTNLLDTGAPFYDVYETSDGKHVSVGAIEPQFYDELVRLLGVDAPDRTDPATWPELRELFTKTFAQRTQAEWIDIFDGSDACVAPVLPLAGEHPHLAARGTFVDKDGVRQAAPAPRFSRTPTELGEPPARPGQHTREALTEWGLANVDELLRSGAAVQAETN
ncbi:L-carnitine dehydratase/bile acid-inducible protein F [Kribbella flavida DSM 17836]|uniref:L-carnitine dehydratase/bile acid-inducible protein F n=1 Tax=Kribbella flavida (strain DSM 17836 / JCM 10339 / NBRC 14399) TaxID=479435 RepID=D2PNS6_KRIFD|nr:CaiB/BaiF CoA-transferase family protein [Kribbella flavida]ADB32744.1 L-carnitine dehydratase/bile acid-inducible protein F [Kribbella flavida DSM 17836]